MSTQRGVVATSRITQARELGVLTLDCSLESAARRVEASLWRVATAAWRREVSARSPPVVAVVVDRTVASAA